MFNFHHIKTLDSKKYLNLSTNDRLYVADTDQWYWVDTEYKPSFYTTSNSIKELNLTKDNPFEIEFMNINNFMLVFKQPARGSLKVIATNDPLNLTYWQVQDVPSLRHWVGHNLATDNLVISWQYSPLEDLNVAKVTAIELYRDGGSIGIRFTTLYDEQYELVFKVHWGTNDFFPMLYQSCHNGMPLGYVKWPQVKAFVDSQRLLLTQTDKNYLQRIDLIISQALAKEENSL